MSNSWRPVEPANSYGIAIYNYCEDADYKLTLTVGDAVQLLEEDDHWYYGHVLCNRHATGVFPKSYIHVKVVDVVEGSNEFKLREPPITQEITCVLREWGMHLKNLYMKHSIHFDEMKNQIHDLIRHRSKILSGTLPVDELKRVTRQAAEEIDMGNKILGLDLVVRDKNGNLINPESTSTLQLYYFHKNATERMSNRAKMESKIIQPKTAIQQYSNIFILSVRNFTFKMTEDAELLMTLYDGKELRPITEYYVVPWKKEGLMSDLEQMNNLRVMFTDLGKRDLEREKIYLVCNVVRIGAMDTKEPDHRRSSTMSVSSNNKKSSSEGMRRPCGVAVLDITSYMNGTCEIDLEQEKSVPFVSCEKDTLEQTLRKIVGKERIENKNQALFVSMKLLRGDLKQVREENPHLVLGNVAIARKMGFPEVILPGDVRNDLYLTLVNGEFSKGNKTCEKNVEVVVRVCNEYGKAVPGVISMGGSATLDTYKSVIYYHEDKPQWHETFKVAIPIEDFKTSHITFTFKHRSSNEAKDKNEKPFAICYVKLMQENGTTLMDARHHLVVYKIDWKKFDPQTLEYLNLPSMLEETASNKVQVPGLTPSTKDNFTISSNICSTKLTQNVDLLGLLNWSTHKDTLTDSLEALMKVDGEEVVKFLQDILDALFNILMDNQETDTYDTLVFECLLHIISLVSNDWKYQHFEPVLDLYIKESFSATLAYKKLISVVTSVVTAANTLRDGSTKDTSLLFKTMKSLQYVMRFVSKSRILYNELYAQIEDDDFVVSLRILLNKIIKMMASVEDGLLREQGACLKYFPSTIPDILLVFDDKELSYVLKELLEKIPDKRLTKQKMMTINDIVHSQLFLRSECRAIMMPLITTLIKVLIERKEEARQDGRRQNRSVAKVAQLLGTTEQFVNQHVGYPEEVELCIKILSDILELLFNKNVGPVDDDIAQIISVDLRSVIQHHINIAKDNPQAINLVILMIDIFRQMTEEHYNNYISNFSTRVDILDFLTEILVVFRELVNNSVFPSDWCDMIMLQNSIILKLLRFFSHTIFEHFFKNFEHDAWSNFFHCAIAFMTQPALQLENFSTNKRMRIIQRYNDMRRKTAFEVRHMWFNLGTHKVKFVPSLVGLILEMTLIPEIELRKATIVIFFDMMQCEYYSSKLEAESYGDTIRNSSHNKGSFCDFEKEIISKLDVLFEGGKGDQEFKDLFYEIMTEHCTRHTAMKEYGIKFVKIVTRLMENLLEYRDIVMDESKENRMSCTVNLLDFYSEIGKEEMYIRYLHKLYDLHLECDNFTEAAFTLQLYTNLLKWSNDPLSHLLKSNKYPHAKTHRQLKESLYHEIIENYSKGKMWERANEKCQELAQQYEHETFEYIKLSEIYVKMAKFFKDIEEVARPTPEYFRVGYFGRGFPQFLQNKVFIYRGKEYERLVDFNSRILNEFSKAELYNKLTPPGEDITESDKQYIQVNNVEPIMDEKKQRFSGKPISQQIVNYYKVNNIDKFSFSRKFMKKDPKIESNNEFAHLWLERIEMTTTYTLPGILRWFPVKDSVKQDISPLRYAISSMEKVNKKLECIVTMFKSNQDSVEFRHISLVISGILDPAVMGGIKNYEEAFFQTNYEEVYPEEAILIRKLKDLIADQIPLMKLCLKIHKHVLPHDSHALQKHLEECFNELRSSVEEKYGKGNCELKLDNEVQMRRHTSITHDPSDKPDAFLLSDSVGGGRSRGSSLTKNQLRQFTSSFNFAATISPASNSKFAQSVSKSLMQSPSKSLSGTPSLSHKKMSKTPKEKRRRSSSKSDIGSSTSTLGGTLWYTTAGPAAPSLVTDLHAVQNCSLPNNINSPTSPVVELTEELTPKRPLRSEVEREKRLSRPSSGQFSSSRPVSVTIRGPNSSGNSSNRDSIGTTDSSISEEDVMPPPLPVKHHREADHHQIVSENISFLYSARNSMARASLQINVQSSELDELDVPPTPPPKPPKNKVVNNHV